MLSGEYAVLHGASALAIPTRLGQTFEFTSEGAHIQWDSKDHNGNTWFSCQMDPDDLDVLQTTDSGISRRLQLLLNYCFQFRPELRGSYRIESRLDFDRSWGLGSSSSLVAALSSWADVPFYPLLKSAFSGSGYDVAVGLEKSPILYRIEADAPNVSAINFHPTFSNDLFFVYLGQKQNSESEIQTMPHVWDGQLIEAISKITHSMSRTENLRSFTALVQEHEALLSHQLQRPTIKERIFHDFDGAIKSLGAWGGDFILATGRESAQDYFKNKGYSIVIPYSDMIYSPQPH
ncbi:MAG: GHMP kinase [Flavobacteriales bacterium]|nr:GHMP kinase [Bacteroidota bacterium]MCB9240369.1 GHMP kinase [Flavobacteriales bacterium]